MSTPKPTAIIVGGGPVGLTTALGLERANIDFVLLEERSSVVFEGGSDMTLLPMTMHTLDQLNLLEPLSKVWQPVSEISRIDHQGRPMGILSIFRYMRESTGYYPGVLSRHSLLQTLYKAFSKKSQRQILTGKTISGINSTPEGVTVSCTDDTSYDGAFVIGADGAYSAVRTHMRQLALNAGDSDINEEDPFIINYQALWVRFPAARLPGCKPGSATETHGFGIATQLFVGEKTATVGVYRKVPIPARTSARYSEEDEAVLIKECGHLPLLTESGGNAAICLRDVYEARLGSGLVDLEEGVLPYWRWGGRIVLVGDAAHKFTPSTGSGLNFGIMDSVVLVNQLCAFTKIDDCNQNQSATCRAFEAYQEERYRAVLAGCQQASRATAMATWATRGLRLLDQYVLPNSLVQWLVGELIASKARRTGVIGFKS